MIFFYKNILSTLLILGVFFHSCGNDPDKKIREGKIFPGFQCKKAVAYDYDGSEKGDLIIEKGKIHYSVKKQVTLSKEQTDGLLQILNEKGSYGEDVTRCFKPHLGVIFYDEKDQPRAQISICFLCNQHNSFPLIAAQESVGKSHPKEFHGYSAEGKTKLMSFCKDLGFSNCGGTDAIESPNEE